MIRRLLLTTAALSLAFSAGCRNRCCLNDPDRRPTPYRPPAPNSQFLLPPAGLPTTPAPPGSGGGNSIVPGAGPVDPRNYPPPSFDIPGNTLRPPVKPAPEVLLPEDLPGGTSRSASPGDPGFGVLGGPSGAQPDPLLTAEPTGVPGFVKVGGDLASGRKPALEGFDSLKRVGYKTVIYLHPAGADATAARDVVTKRGLAFVAIETTPEKLADAVTKFNSVVGEKGNRPAYVYDEDGVRAGAVWYLHFRTAESMNDDAARLRAKPLGLTDQGDEAKAFALAIQRYLETR